MKKCRIDVNSSLKFLKFEILFFTKKIFLFLKEILKSKVNRKRSSTEMKQKEGSKEKNIKF
jgi:hypothetical protein